MLNDIEYKIPNFDIIISDDALYHTLYYVGAINRQLDRV